MSAPCAVVLAAGLSSRIQGFKPLLPLGETSLLKRVTALLREAGAGKVLVVTGHRAEEVEEAARKAGAETVRNERYAKGMFTSVRAGVRALPADCGSFFMLPVDIPLIRPPTLRLLLRAGEQRPDSVLHPTFAGRRGHPPLIPAGLKGDILSWSGRGGLAGLLESHPGPSLDVPVPDANILFDVDSDADYAEAVRRVSRLDIPTREESEAVQAAARGVNARGAAHARAVADYALQMARAMGDRGSCPDLGLVEAAALLHDIAKGEPDHERRGGEMLREMGFGRVADIVAVHRDIRPPHGPVTEAEIVYLADKVARGTTLVSVEERFQAKLDQYAADPEAVAAIRGRLANALAVRTRVEQAVGVPLSALLRPHKE